MRKSKFLTYSAILPLVCVGLIASAMFPALVIIERTAGDASFNFSQLDIFLNTMGTNTNYLSYNRIMLLYLLAFAFCLNYLFLADKPCYLVRLKSRNEFVKHHIVDILIFTAFFVFLVEAVNTIFSFAVFGAEMTINLGLLQYSLLDFATEYLFYMRVGLVLLIAGILVNKKYAPFVTFVIYFIEYYLQGYSPILRDLISSDIWLPYTDSVVVTTLLTREMAPIGVIPIIIRGVTMNMGLLILAYYLFKKKDIINNEKK